MKRSSYSRRRFIRDLSMASAAISPAISTLAACGVAPEKKLGIALVGLGGYSSGQLGPALQQTRNCYLAGIVTGTPSKAKDWSARYNIPAANIYNYENFDSIANNPAIDIVYVVLPIAMHKEYTVRAAKAGKHVICEKPMAISVSECEEMIAACRKANRMLSIGYRLHFEPFNKEMMRLGQQKVYGKILEIEAGNGYVYGGDPNAWRLKKALAGGGSLMDMGVYVVQAARYVTGEEPVYVKASEEKLRPELFTEVDETIAFELEFPSGAIARGISSYNRNLNNLKAKAEKGVFELTAAYRYGGQTGYTPSGPMQFPQVNQQALQMDDFANCILQNRRSPVPGEMGLLDLKVIEGIYRSVRSGKREKI